MISLSFYRVISHLLTPFLVLYLRFRARKGKEEPSRLKERFGIATLPRPSNPLVWVHAASVGEMVSVLPLLQAMLEAFPDRHFLLTTGTVSSASLFPRYQLARTEHQFIPLDTPRAVQRFLNHWQPGAALWIESELWPNLVTFTAKRCPLLLINARMSPRSFRFWQRFPSLIRHMLGCFTLCLPQAKQDVEHFVALGAKNVQFYGNLKYCAQPLPVVAIDLQRLRKACSGRIVWIAASTHAGEEDIVIKVHRLLKQRYPTLLTLLIPRHPGRGLSIAHTAREAGLFCARRAALQPITSLTDIYLGDTLGELGLFYRLSQVVFMGGSLVPHGGQNPLEAARFQCALLSGPHIHNFSDIYQELHAQQGVQFVHDVNTLYHALDDLFSHPAKQRTFGNAAAQVAHEASDTLTQVIEAITPYMPAITGNASAEIPTSNESSQDTQE